MKSLRRKAFIFWLATCVLALLAACSAPAAVPPAPTIQAAPSPSPTLADHFVVTVWVDDPTPPRDATVILIGNLSKNGYILGHNMMRATWPDEDQPRGVPNCYVMVSYQRGVCTIDASKYPVGVFVPIQVSFEYEGQTFTGESGFTPR